jgi:hypothetical protein
MAYLALSLLRNQFVVFVGGLKRRCVCVGIIVSLDQIVDSFLTKTPIRNFAARDDKTSLMSPNTDPQLVKAIAAKWRYKLHLIDDTSFIDGPFVVGLLLQAFGTLPDSLRQHYDRVKNNQQSRSFIRKFVTAAAVGATVVALAAGLFVYLRKKK